MSAPVDRRQAEDRRAATSAAIARHFAICDRRAGQRRQSTSAAVAAWRARYDVAKGRS